MVQAAADTLDLALRRRMTQREGKLPSSMQSVHLAEMLVKMAGSDERNEPAMSMGKTGRWLGWMQASVVAAGCATLEEMKDINRRYADAN